MSETHVSSSVMSNSHPTAATLTGLADSTDSPANAPMHSKVSASRCTNSPAKARIMGAKDKCKNQLGYQAMMPAARLLQRPGRLALPKRCRTQAGVAQLHGSQAGAGDAFGHLWSCEPAREPSAAQLLVCGSSSCTGKPERERLPSCALHAGLRVTNWWQDQRHLGSPQQVANGLQHWQTHP